MDGRLQPALLGGLFIGVLSALPIVNMGNCCCCLWVVAGGALAVYLRQQNHPVPLNAAEGALLGLMAGLIGGIISAILSIPMQMMLGPMQAEWMTRILESNRDLPPDFRDAMERAAGGGAVGAMAAFGAIVGIITSVVFGMLGGLLGVAIFKKNAPPSAPPPPPTIIPHDPGVAH